MALESLNIPHMSTNIGSELKLVVNPDRKNPTGYKLYEYLSEVDDPEKAIPALAEALVRKIPTEMAVVCFPNSSIFGSEFRIISAPNYLDFPNLMRAFGDQTDVAHERGLSRVFSLLLVSAPPKMGDNIEVKDFLQSEKMKGLTYSSAVVLGHALRDLMVMSHKDRFFEALKRHTLAIFMKTLGDYMLRSPEERNNGNGIRYIGYSTLEATRKLMESSPAQINDGLSDE